jgi:hypothetical protein
VGLVLLGIGLVVVEVLIWAGFHAGAHLVPGVVTHTSHRRKSFHTVISVDLPSGTVPPSVTVEGLFFNPAVGTAVDVLINEQHHLQARLPGWRGSSLLVSTGVFAILAGAVTIVVDHLRRRREELP